ncbi:MAG: hypothetical protein WA876_12145 [Candidatus Acidiferrales bacterium]
MDVFTFERKPIAPFATTHFIYADAWAEFDKLESRRDGNAASWMRRLVEVFIFTVPLGGIVLAKRYIWMIATAWVFLMLLELGYRLRLKNQFLNWRCPHCRTKWPGTKEEKDSACRVCGLRLHQLTP